MSNLYQNYIKIKEVAEAKNKSERSIRRYCQQNKYEFRTVRGNGGLQYEVLFTSLEPEIQAKLQAKNVKLPVIKGSDDSTISVAVTVQAPVSLLNINVVPEKAKCLIETFGLNKMQSDNRVIPEFAKKKVIVQATIESEKRTQLRLAAEKNDIKVSPLLELFIDNFILAPEKMLKILKECDLD